MPDSPRPVKPRQEAGHVVHVLHPGDVALATRGDVMETLLGSCVSVILTDPRRTVGVMCHIVHPSGGPVRGPRAGAHLAGARAAMHHLLVRRGIQPGMCEAFVYGGGNMFPNLMRGVHVGHQNAEGVLAMLRRDGNAVLIEDLGGTKYRRLAWTVGPDLPTVSAVSMEEADLPAPRPARVPPCCPH